MNFDWAQDHAGPISALALDVMGFLDNIPYPENVTSEGEEDQNEDLMQGAWM